MKYGNEMSSGAMIHIPSFIKIRSGTQKLIGGGKYIDTLTQRHTDRLEIAHAYFHFFK
jgi:hypothetical protein